MNTTTTLERETTLDANTVRQPGSNKKKPMGGTIAVVVGGILFLGLCAYIAFSGGDQAATGFSSSSTTTAAAAVASEPVVVPAEDVVVESDAAAPVADETPAEPAAEEAIEEPVTEAPAEEPAEEATVMSAPAGEQPRDAIIGPDSPPAPPNAPEQYSIFSGGKLFMRGVVPSAEIEAQLVRSVGAIVGPDNAISEYSIDPTREVILGEASVVYINDTVLFATGSSEIPPDFYPLIATAPIMLSIQPDVVLTITGHTDNVGSDSSNQILSQARVDAVREWIIGQGGDAERIIAIGEGASSPIADNATEQGRQANRRVEFVIEGFDFTVGS